MTHNLGVGDIVLCTVERIAGTIVFVKISLPGEELEGSIILSEIAPGRIRNLRDYVIPKKKIICKVLRVSGDRIDLSLRRVTQKEKKELTDKDKQEKSCSSVLKTVLGDRTKEIIQDIIKKESVFDFCERIKTNPKDLEKYAKKEEIEKIQSILKTQKRKSHSLKKEFTLTTTEPNGLEIIKELLSHIKEAKIGYITAGKYILRIESENPKKADTKLKEILEEIERKTKKKNINFSIKEK